MASPRRLTRTDRPAPDASRRGRRRRPFAAVVAAVVVTGLGPAGCADVRCPPGLEPVTISGEPFCLEVAADPPSIGQGLMHRASIPEDGGMLFIFPDVRLRSFWMAYCLVDIDIIFLDGQGRVTATHRMKTLPPRRAEESEFLYESRARRDGSYSSRLPAQFAIELRAGTLERLGLRVDDRVPLDLPRLKAMAR